MKKERVIAQKKNARAEKETEYMKKDKVEVLIVHGQKEAVRIQKEGAKKVLTVKKRSMSKSTVSSENSL